MKVLGIESTAHTFGVGIVNKNKVLANVKDSFTTTEGGMILDEVAEHHKAVKDSILKKALKEAKLSMEDIDLIAYSEGPGLPPALLVGKYFALELSEKYNQKLLGVNHIIAHLEIGLNTTKAKNPIFLFCSGANTQVIAHEGGKYRVFGEALSIAIGNAFDKFARNLGLGFPGGPQIEKLAKDGEFIKLTYNVKGMDVDFSGLVTQATNLYQKGASKEDLCFSLQETAFAMLIEVTERALAHCEKNEVLLIGGVAANKRFSQMLKDMCEARGAKAYTVELQYAGDQGAMIAYQGYLERKREQKEFDIIPKWRIDEIDTFWKK
jgi:N6-L-threonylcarbamoyladenine synthase